MPRFQCSGDRMQETTIYWLVPMDRIELSTSPLPRECSTPELHGHIQQMSLLFGDTICAGRQQGD